MQRFGHHAPEEDAEIVGLRTSIVGTLAKPGLRRLERGRPAIRWPRWSRSGWCVSTPARVSARVYDRARLRAGDAFRGPALVEESGSLTCVPAGVDVRVADAGHLNLLVESYDDGSPHRHRSISAEIIRSALVAITDEMKTNLMRTAYNPIIYEALDYTVGLFDADGNTMSIGLGLPMFIRGLSDAIKAKLEFYGRDGIEPGDILLTNDAYIMGSHLNHLIFTLPIFHEGQLVAFSSSMAHWIDIGGVIGGTTQDIFSEGLQTPDRQDFQTRRTRSRADRNHPDQRPSPGAGDGRLSRSNRRHPHRRAALQRAAPQVRRVDGTHVRGSAVRTQRADCAARRSPRFRTACTKPTRTWTTTASAATRCRSKFASPWPATA